MIQTVDNPVDAPALRYIDDGIADGVENLAGVDYFRVTEKHDTVAVAVGRGFMICNHRLAVEPVAQLEELTVICIGRLCTGRRGGLSSCGSAHARQYVLVREDHRSSPAGIGASKCNLLVTAHVFGSSARVKD